MLSCVLCSGTGWAWGTPWDPPPHAGPVVHSHGMTALHWAALYGNRRMIRSLVDADADVNAQMTSGAPFALAANRPMSAPAESPPPSAVQVDAAALCRVDWPVFIRRGAAAARRRRGRPGQIRVTLRCAAQPKPKTAAAARAQVHAEAMGGILREARGIRGGGEGGALRPPPHDPRPPPLPRAPSLPELLVPSVFAVGARRSSGEGGDSQRSTRTITSALAARLVEHHCTRGSKCRAHRARADALIGSAKCARASTAVPRTAMWDRRAVHAHTLAARRNATLPFRPLSRRI